MVEWQEPVYKLVTTEESLNSLLSVLKKAIKNDVPISIDIETTGASPKCALDRYHGWLLGISFSVDKTMGYYIPLAHTKDGVLRPEQLKTNYVVDILKPMLSSGGIYLGHNLKFDYGFLCKFGLDLFPNMWDTMLALKMIYGGIFKSARLKDVISEYINIPIDVVVPFGEASEGNAAEVDPIEFVTYAVNDVIFVYYLYEAIKPIIDLTYAKLFYEAEMLLLPLLVQMELKGIKIDKDYLLSIRGPLEKVRDELKAKYDFNIGSTAQVGSYLNNNFGSLRLKRSAKGNIVTDVEALQTILRDYRETDGVYQVAADVLKFRKIEKALSTYIDKYPAICEHQYSNKSVIYVLHTGFNQMINSGRLSSSPNVQNLTRDSEDLSIRKGFVAREGYKFVEGDWSSAELRLTAIASGESKMVQAYIDDPINADLHTLTAQGIFGVKEVTKEQRHIGKTLNFSLLYGATEYSISKTLNCTKEEALKYIEEWYNTYPGVRDWKIMIENKIAKDRYSETFYGRRRYLGNTTMPNMREQWKYKGAVRELTNHIIQGTCADLLKFSMVNVAKKFALEQLENTYILSTTHDSILAEVEDAYVDQAVQIMKSVMEIKINDILMPVDFEIKDSFAKVA